MSNSQEEVTIQNVVKGMTKKLSFLLSVDDLEVAKLNSSHFEKAKEKLSGNSNISFQLFLVTKQIHFAGTQLSSKINALSSIVLEKEDLIFEVSLITNTQNVVQVIQKKPIDRTSYDLAIIFSILSHSDLAHKFHNDHIDEDHLTKMLYFCSLFIGYQYYSKNTIVFRIGDKADKFFIILEGRINILKPIPKKEYMSPYQYYEFLQRLISSNEIYLVKLMIEANLQTFPIDIKDIHQLKEIVFRVKYRQVLMENPKGYQIQKLFEVMKVNPADYKLNFLSFRSEANVTDREFFSLVRNQLLLLSESDNFLTMYETYKYFESEIPRPVICYIYEQFLTLNTGAFFGDFALDSNTARTATIVAGKKTHLGFLTFEIYNEYLKQEKQKLHLKEISFLIDNFFLSPIHRNYFETKYFSDFLFEEKNKGDILFNEGDEMRYIYFIKEGEVELSMTKNLIELNQLITFLSQLKGIDLTEYNNYYLKQQPNSIIDHLMKKLSFKIFQIGNKQMLGEHSYCNKIPSLFLGRVASEKLKIYKLEYKNIRKIFMDMKECKPILDMMEENKARMLLKRLIDLKNIKFSLIDRKDDTEKQKVISDNNTIFQQREVRKQMDVIHLTHMSIEHLSSNITPIKQEDKKIDKMKPIMERLPCLTKRKKRSMICSCTNENNMLAKIYEDMKEFKQKEAELIKSPSFKSNLIDPNFKTIDSCFKTLKVIKTNKDKFKKYSIFDQTYKKPENTSDYKNYICSTSNQGRNYRVEEEINETSHDSCIMKHSFKLSYSNLKDKIRSNNQYKKAINEQIESQVV